MERYSVRLARADEQGELTRLCVRVTLGTGYDAAFIDRAMPALTITAPSITADAVQVAEQLPGVVVGVVSVMLSPIAGIARLGSMFVDPPS